MKPKITVIQASLLYKVTVRTIYNWIKADNIQAENSLYSLDELQNSYDKRRTSKPRLRYK